jgi:hypothetical protein
MATRVAEEQTATDNGRSAYRHQRVAKSALLPDDGYAEVIPVTPPATLLPA